MALKYRIAVYNAISARGLERFPSAPYIVGKGVSNPDAILLRSHVLQISEIPASVKAIARAGAGVNNIPVDEMSKRGVPVFNAPGANANAVKELVLAAILLAARNLVPAVAYVQALAAGTISTSASRKARSSSRASSFPGARSASSAWGRSAGSSPTPRSGSA